MRPKLGESGARLTLVYLALFPMTLFLQAVYAESLFLCLAVGAFLAAARRRWEWAGLLGGLACLSRPTGFALLVPLALFAWRSTSRVRALASLLLAPVVFSAFPIVLRIQLGSPWGFMHAERFWHRNVSPFGPFDGVYRALKAAWAGTLQLTVGSPTHWYWTPVDPSRAAALNLEYLAT